MALNGLWEAVVGTRANRPGIIKSTRREEVSGLIEGRPSIKT